MKFDLSSSSADIVKLVRTKLDNNERIQINFTPWGIVNIDRQLPFLCVYRKPDQNGDAGTDRLITGEASYLLAPAGSRFNKCINRLVAEIAKKTVDGFGSILILEVWAGETDKADREGTGGLLPPRFKIHAPALSGLASTIEKLEQSLAKISIQKQRAKVKTLLGGKPKPPAQRLLLSPKQTSELSAHIIGLEINPIYRDHNTGRVHPMALRTMGRELSRALKLTFFEFSRAHTTHAPPHYQALGKNAVVKAVWEVDRQLADLSSSFDFLLALTPVNQAMAWANFRQNKFQREPEFIYRPIPVEPALLKRDLYKVPLERIEDPVLAQLFSEKQEELDRQITMLSDRHHRTFLYESLQLYGGVSDKSLHRAQSIMYQTSSRHPDESSGGNVSAKEFVKQALAEIEKYKAEYPKISARVEIRNDVIGLMANNGHLFIGDQTTVPASRVEALIAHEIGTHLVTYYNGKSQRFRQLYTGFAGYDELQEGLAVLAEYLVGGLSQARLRLLAARVIAVRHMIDGASFIDIFNELYRSFDFQQRAAFNITMRVYRGGGLTKDAIYLEGLVKLLAYLKRGGKLDQLFIGKVSLHHMRLIKELQWRNVLGEPRLRPHYLDKPDTIERLERLKKGMSVLDLVHKRRS